MELPAWAASPGMMYDDYLQDDDDDDNLDDDDDDVVSRRVRPHQPPGAGVGVCLLPGEAITEEDDFIFMEFIFPASPLIL